MVVGPELKQIPRKGQAQASKPHQHQGSILGIKASLKIRRNGPRAGANQTEPLFRQPPVHGEVKRAAQQQITAAVGLSSSIGPALEGRAQGAIDVIPPEIAHPHQRCIEALGQGGCGRGNVPDDQHRLPLRRKPESLSLDQGRQPLLQLIQGPEGGGAIHTERVGLHHAHIPLTRPLLNRCIPQQQVEYGGGQTRAHHQGPFRTQAAQLLEHRSIASRMAEAMAAAAEIDQHGNGASIGNCS